MDDLWGEVFVLDPLAVPEPEGQSIAEPALQPYLTMLRAAEAEALISARQNRRLAYASGGLPRTFIQCCNACVLYALQSEANHVLDHHVDLVLQDMANKWRGRLTDADYQAIIKVVDSEGSNVRDAAKALRNGILLRDGTRPPDQQYRVAPWAAALVQTYRKRRGVARQQRREDRPNPRTAT